MNLYPAVVYERSGNSSGKAANEDEVVASDEMKEVVDNIQAACKGFGNDKVYLGRTLGKLTPTQRCFVPIRYEQMTGKPLKKALEKELGTRSNFGEACNFLAVDPVEAEVDMIVQACSEGLIGLRSDKRVLYSILAGRSNADMECLKKKFFDLHGKDLGAYLAAQLSGSFETFVLAVTQANAEDEYNPEIHSDEKLKHDAKTLYECGEGKRGTDATFFTILAKSPAEYLTKLNLTYAEKYGLTLTKLLEEELSGKTDDAALYLLKMKLEPIHEMARLFDQACAGRGANEFLLTATLIRLQSHMAALNDAHVALFGGKSIRDRILEETKGDYEKILLEIYDTGMRVSEQQ